MKLIQYIICYLIIISSVFCGIGLYNELTSESYINGSLNIENTFITEDFIYSNTQVTFYHDIYDETELYYFTIDLLPIEDFNGLKNNYEIIINNYILYHAEITAGAISASLSIDFYDTTGIIECSSELIINVSFLSSKTILILSTYGQQSSQFLQQYFTDNGINLSINNIKEA